MYKNFEKGRSMIEMLGVLAIIAVLSVGGIAGYSKAMEKFKVNKLIAEYNMLVFGIMEHKENIIHIGKNSLNLNQLVEQLNIVPETWKIAGIRLDDGFGNLVYPYFTKGGLCVIDSGCLVIDFNLGGLSANAQGKETSATFSDKLCFEIFNTMLISLHDAIIYAYMYRNGTSSSVRYFGDSTCGNGKKCLKDMNFSEIKSLCGLCDKANQRCNITFYF